ncbi:hypothetical protein AB0C96_34125 [Streptomyces sp. NPDC048506]|uniref:hypothetical protein n=1 Tax=Streptomyces sp. NPDC048506 TaxID=3155028 RepID=UPI003441390D
MSGRERGQERAQERGQGRGRPTGSTRGPAIRTRTRGELRRSRRPRAHACWDHLYAAPLWPLHGANLGTLLRTCDAVGACMTVPRFSWVPEALVAGSLVLYRLAGLL